MIIGVVMGETLVDEEAEELDFDLISHIPWEQVINLGTSLLILRSEELCIETRNLTHLNLANIDLSTWFAGPDGMRDISKGGIQLIRTYSNLLRLFVLIRCLFFDGQRALNAAMLYK